MDHQSYHMHYHSQNSTLGNEAGMTQGILVSVATEDDVAASIMLGHR